MKHSSRRIENIYMGFKKNCGKAGQQLKDKKSFLDDCFERENFRNHLTSDPFIKLKWPRFSFICIAL